MLENESNGELLGQYLGIRSFRLSPVDRKCAAFRAANSCCTLKLALVASKSTRWLHELDGIAVVSTLGGQGNAIEDPISVVEDQTETHIKEYSWDGLPSGSYGIQPGFRVAFRLGSQPR